MLNYEDPVLRAFAPEVKAKVIFFSSLNELDEGLFIRGDKIFWRKDGEETEVIRLKELGGDYEDEYICAMFGNLALCKFAAGSTVIASLRFQTHESNGSYFQDVVATDIQNIHY